ncbi:MAG: AAA family ATPase [Kiritimatiellae bacterium]|nr:AAA family ATPase [Kiritimatiellia bacterium]
MQTNIQERIWAEIEDAAENPIVISHEYLDDEQLPQERQFEVLTEIFNTNVRTHEIRTISNHFSPVFRNGHPTHLSVIGSTGTGKTITIRWFLAQIEKFCAGKGIPFQQVHLDLCCPTPCFRALNNLACLLDASKRYRKGVSLEEIMGRVEAKLKSSDGYLAVFVDEADNVRTDFNTFYQFLVKRLPKRIGARLVLIFTSNRLDWMENLDPRVKSCLKVRELSFKSYDADSLKRILTMRVKKALQPSRIEEGVIDKIAALASQQHGDARKAVNLLRRSADLAEQDRTAITLELVDRAYEEIERDKYIDMIRSSPKQLQAALYAALTGKPRTGALHTGPAYLVYERFCSETGLRPISQRAFSDLLYELDMYGFIRARTVSRGRYGRTKEIRTSFSRAIMCNLVRTIRETFSMPPGVMPL